MATRKSSTGQIQPDPVLLKDPEETAKNAFSSPTALVNRIKANRPFPRSDQRDDGVSVASSRKGYVADADSASAVSKSTANKSPSVTAKGSHLSKDKPRNPTLRNLADVAGLSLHDTPPKVPVDSLQHQTKAMPPLADGSMAKNPKQLASSKKNVAKGRASNTASAANTDVDPDLVSAIEKLVDTTTGKQTIASSGGSKNAPSPEIASLTRQIGQMAESRRTPRSTRSVNSSTNAFANHDLLSPSMSSMRRSTPRGPPTPESSLRSPPNSPPTSHGFADPASNDPQSLDLKQNDNAFTVIADLVLQPFKNGANLTKEARAELDANVPPQMRQSFVEAVRYRLKHNCPPGSSEHIHAVTRKCQVLGFDKDNAVNPLLATSADNSTVANGKPPKAVELSAAEALARQQLLAELREASNFMADSKTKEASNFWRNHVLELQARLYTLQGDAPIGSNATDAEIMTATARLLEDSDPPSTIQPPRGYVPPSGDGASQSLESNVSSGRDTASESGSSGFSESWAEGGILVKGGVMNQLAYLRDLYELIDLLIALLEIERILDFVDSQKIPEKIADVLNHMDPEKALEYFQSKGYDKYLDPQYLEQSAEEMFDNTENFLDNLEERMDPENFKMMMDDMTRTLLGPDQLREAMNLDRIREMSDPVALRYYFEQNGLDKVWDLDKLKEIMEAKKLREALDAHNIRDVLKSQQFRVFMGDSYRGPNPMVDVVAPSTLPGGYRFEAEIDGHRFLATVPACGVKKGETFSCLMKDLDSMFGGDIPVGGWRDRQTDFLTNGICHPVVWTTVFCPLLTLGQIMTRLKYDFLGRPRTKPSSSFAVVTSIVVMWLTLNLAIFVAYNIKWSMHIELSVADFSALVFVNVAMLLYAIYATSSTRASIREKYMIREHRCYDLEDCICATFCMPSTICQMARHTADYTKYEAACCTETGLDDGAALPKTGSNVSDSKYFCADAQGTDYWCTDERDLV